MFEVGKGQAFSCKGGSRVGLKEAWSCYKLGLELI